VAWGYASVETLKAIVSSGADCSPILSMLEKNDNWMDREPDTQQKLIDGIKRSGEKVAAQKEYIRRMESRLTELAGIFERKWGMRLPLSMAVVDASTSRRFVCGHDRIFRLDPYYEFIGYELPKNTTADARLHVFYGKIRLITSSIGKDGFDGDIYHEFAHLLREPKKLLKKIRNRLEKDGDKKKAKFLTGVLEEGFAEFVSQQTANASQKHVCTPALCAEFSEKLDKHGWQKISSDEEFKVEFAYSLGSNFFSKAHAVLALHPIDYMRLLSVMPPTDNELLSMDGGTGWADRALKIIK
jgi:hypothetical protein